MKKPRLTPPESLDQLGDLLETWEQEVVTTIDEVDKIVEESASPQPYAALGTGFRPQDGQERLAFWLSQLFSPPSVMMGLLLVIAFTEPRPSVWIYALVYFIFAMLLPLLFIVWQVRRGTITDVDVQLREQRKWPQLVTIGGTLIAYLIISANGGPRSMLVLSAASLLQSTAFYVVTLRWKVSVHAATAAGALVILVWRFGPTALAAVLVLLLVGWSRVRLRRHSLGQAIAGAVMGVATFLGAIWLLG